MNQRWFPALHRETLKEYAARGEQPYSDTPKLKAMLGGAVPFAVHNIAHHFYEDDNERSWTIEDFPRPVPPFSTSWFEWSAPRFLVEHCQFERLGCLVFPVPELSAGTTWACLPFVQRRDGDIGTWPLFIWATDSDGALLEIDGIAPESKIRNSAALFVGQYYEGLPSEEKDALSYISERLAAPVLFSLSLLHCKNAVQREAIQSPSLVKARAKRGLWSRSAFKVIEIRPMTKTAKSAGNQQETRRRQTIRRGHFKDYKEGAGLFGKVHGLYWWDQVIEGEAAATAYKFNKAMFPSLEILEESKRSPKS